MKKIALIYLGRLGAGPVYTIEMARALLDEGSRVLAFISEYSENIEEWKELERRNDNFELFPVKTYRNIAGLLAATLNIRRFGKIKTALDRFAPDVLYSTMIHTWNPVIFWLGRKTKFRVKTIHDAMPHRGENGLLSRLLHATEYRQATNYVVLSEVAIPVVTSRGIAPEQIIHIPHAHFGVYATKEAARGDGLFNRFIFFGRINEYKGLGVLLEAMRKINAAAPHLTLVVAGNGNVAPYADAFGKLAHCLDLKIRWIEHDEVGALMNDTDFIILPYIEATQSGVIPLACGLRKPVVATNVGGIPEQVENGVTGILIPPSSSDAIAQAVLELYSTPERIKSMGDADYDYAMRELSWQKSARILLDACRN
jgi:glycosyltransferase involved in cell wall biosynthesis